MRRVHKYADGGKVVKPLSDGDKSINAGRHRARLSRGHKYGDDPNDTPIDRSPNAVTRKLRLAQGRQAAKSLMGGVAANNRAKKKASKKKASKKQ